MTRRLLADAADDIGLALLDQLPDVAVFAKDRQRRFAFCNQACARMLGVEAEADVIGRRDQDFSPPYLCERYARDDEAVLRTGRALVEKLELVRHRDRSIGWHSTTKVAIRNRKGDVIGLAGMTRDLKQRSPGVEHLALAPAIEAMMNGYRRALPIIELARSVALSVRQFERQFRRHFATTPQRYLIRIRIDAACEDLATTDVPIVDIAASAGFFDQSHFTRAFARQTGLTPLRYRERHRGKR